MNTPNENPIHKFQSTDMPTRPRQQAYPKIAVRRLPASGGISASVVEGVKPQDKHSEERKRRLLVLFEMVLLLVFVGQSVVFIGYLVKPKPLPELLPASVSLSFPPHYVFSIYSVDKPVSVALSPDGDRIYVAETEGERLVKIFDRDGKLTGSFAPPRTITPERSPVYLAVSQSGKVFVSDRAQHAIFVFDALGNYLDTILSPTLTLSEFVSKHTGGLAPGTRFGYNLFDPSVYYQKPGETEQTLPAPDIYDWSPLGLRVDLEGRLIFTDVADDRSLVQFFPQSAINSEIWTDFDYDGTKFGEYGQQAGELAYPNSAIVDSRGRVFVSDSNNSRISVWDSQGNFLFNFGRGTGDGALSLPRGLALDEKERLYIVDPVGQSVKVFNVSGDEVDFLFTFGEYGMGDGQFNYPNDVALDKTGRVYVVDRENNRVQVWLY